MPTEAEKEAKAEKINFYYPLQRDACDKVRQFLDERRIPHLFSDEPSSNATTGTHLTVPNPAPTNVTASTVGMPEAEKAGWIFNSSDPFVADDFNSSSPIHLRLFEYLDILSRIKFRNAKPRFLERHNIGTSGNIPWDRQRGILNGVYLDSLLSTFRDDRGTTIDFVERFSVDEDSKEAKLEIGIVGDTDHTLSSSNMLSPLLISSILSLAPYKKPDDSQSTTNLSSISELAVERSTGHTVCTTLEEGMEGLLHSGSDQYVPELPAILTISLSRPKPDFFLLFRGDSFGKTDQGVKILAPVIAVAESKKNASVASRARVQLASAVHSTLVYFLVQHYSSHPSFVPYQTEPLERALPKDAFVFSVYYDVNCVAIYANYPCVAEKRGQKYWRFRCSLFFIYQYKEPQPDDRRLAFLMVMCWVRKQNIAVHTRMKLFKEPEEMKLLREGWAGLTKGWDEDWKKYAKTQKAEEGDKKETEVGDKKEIQKKQPKREEKPSKAKAPTAKKAKTKKTKKTNTTNTEDDDDPTDDDPTDKDPTYE